mmetsp:Transcript_37554/g.94807  ORF Transcript_37554/g.94807 Transcript_37554/m.94807 type:complete len:450 (-) Transcript_37554:467-1816(-)
MQASVYLVGTRHSVVGKRRCGTLAHPTLITMRALPAALTSGTTSRDACSEKPCTTAASLHSFCLSSSFLPACTASLTACSSLSLLTASSTDGVAADTPVLAGLDTQALGMPGTLSARCSWPNTLAQGACSAPAACAAAASGSSRAGWNQAMPGSTACRKEGVRRRTRTSADSAAMSSASLSFCGRVLACRACSSCHASSSHTTQFSEPSVATSSVATQCLSKDRCSRLNCLSSCALLATTAASPRCCIALPWHSACSCACCFRWRCSSPPASSASSSAASLLAKVMCSCEGCSSASCLTCARVACLPATPSVSSSMLSACLVHRLLRSSRPGTSTACEVVSSRHSTWLSKGRDRCCSGVAARAAAHVLTTAGACSCWASWHACSSTQGCACSCVVVAGAYMRCSTRSATSSSHCAPTPTTSTRRRDPSGCGRCSGLCSTRLSLSSCALK